MANDSIGYLRVQQTEDENWLDKIGHEELNSRAEFYGLSWDGFDEDGNACMELYSCSDLIKLYRWLYDEAVKANVHLKIEVEACTKKPEK